MMKESRKVCPQGYRIPNKNDFETLISFAATMGSGPNNAFKASNALIDPADTSLWGSSKLSLINAGNLREFRPLPSAWTLVVPLTSFGLDNQGRLIGFGGATTLGFMNPAAKTVVYWSVTRAVAPVGEKVYAAYIMGNTGGFQVVPFKHFSFGQIQGPSATIKCIKE